MLCYVMVATVCGNCCSVNDITCYILNSTQPPEWLTRLCYEWGG